MPIIQTDLRETRESARRLRFEPTALLPDTDVQTAIEDVETQLQAAIVLPAGYSPTIVTFAMSPYTPLATDTVLLVNTTGGAVSIQMPLSATRLNASGYVPLTVKDDVGNAAINAIAVLRAGAETIDGLTSYPIDAPYASVTFQPKAAGYDVV
jgi:hypothetical protein